MLKPRARVVNGFYTLDVLPETAGPLQCAVYEAAGKEIRAIHEKGVSRHPNGMISEIRDIHGVARIRFGELS